jgi:septum formation protein
MFARCCQKKFQVVHSVIAIFSMLVRHVPQADGPCLDAAWRDPGAHLSSRMKIVLASTSRYRRELLNRLQVPFSAVNPGIEESALPGEPPEAMATRLATAKALAVASDHPDAVIIGCDQVAVSEGKIVGKPGNHENAVRQLRELSGRDAIFYTAICVHDASSGRTAIRVVPYRVKFRVLDDAVIQRYLERERPYDCAGSAKSEGLGIALIERMEGEDPNALVGLPLIALVDLLGECGVQIP